MLWLALRPLTESNMEHIAVSDRSSSIATLNERRAVYAKVGWRLVPFLFLCYMLNFVDRVNISFAHLQFQKDIGLSDAAYGLGVGLFFIGYVALEVPSNLLLKRIGARLTISRIMLLWGFVSAGLMFVQSPVQFYVARTLLGIAEGGFFPGVVLYLTYWFPSAKRARITSRLFLAVAVAGTLGGPVSGWILMHMNGAVGLRGWQWLFLLEGAPAALVGLIAYFYLDDRPTHAQWLTERERMIIAFDLVADENLKTTACSTTFGQVLRDPRIYLLSLGYMVVPWASSVLNFWGPSIIRKSGIANLADVGLLSAVPYIFGAGFMILVCRSSDRTMERRWHFGAVAVLTAVGLAFLPAVSNDWLASIVLLTVATAGYLTAVALFWTIPPAYLSGPAAAGGIGLVSCIGQSGGLVAPVVFSWSNSLTNSASAGFYVVAGVIVCAGLSILIGVPASRLHERRSDI
jgi:ACS family phthalate transporter-like MFS transporter